MLASQFALACLAVLPATFFMGAIFPVTIRIVNAKLSSVGRDVGNAYALNTVGAITGSFFSGFVILPVLGLQKGIYLAAVIDLGLAAMLLAVAPTLVRGRKALGMGVAVGLAITGLFLPRWNLTNFSIGFFRISMARASTRKRSGKRRSWSITRTGLPPPYRWINGARSSR